MDNQIKYLHELLKKWEATSFDFLPSIVLAILVFIVCYLFARLLRKISFKSYNKIFNGKTELARIISSVVYGVVLMVGVFLTLEVLGLEHILTRLLAGAGVMGIVVGFAVKDIAANAFAGFLVSTQRPFKEGDWVSLDKVYGTVENIGWITTSIKTITGQEVFVPNQLIYSSTFTNYSVFHKRRVVFQSGVSYGDDLALVKKAALEEVQYIKGLLPDEPIDFYFTDIGSSTYNFELRFWIKFSQNTDYLNAMSDIIMRIKTRFEREDICIAYNVTTLDFGVKGGVNLFDQAIKTQPNAVNNEGK